MFFMTLKELYCGDRYFDVDCKGLPGRYGVKEGQFYLLMEPDKYDYLGKSDCTIRASFENFKPDY